MLEAMASEANGEGGAESTNAEGGGVRDRERLPNFIVHEPVGAGRAIKRVTSAVGV